jgi:hypothetical protein
MDGKSNRNEEIKILAEFRDRAIPSREAPTDHGQPVGSRSVNQEIHPFADFRDKAQPLDEKKTAASATNVRVEIVIDADIAPFFPTNESVNEALRKWLSIAGLDGNPNAAL